MLSRCSVLRAWCTQAACPFPEPAPFLLLCRRGVLSPCAGNTTAASATPVSPASGGTAPASPEPTPTPATNGTSEATNGTTVGGGGGGGSNTGAAVGAAVGAVAAVAGGCTWRWLGATGLHLFDDRQARSETQS